MPREKVKVYLNDLDEDMTILAYVGFNRSYHSLSKKTCFFVKSHFKGTKSIVNRNGKIIKIRTENLLEGDRLTTIHSFPRNKNHLTEVSDRLIIALRKHGMLRFEVERPARLTFNSHNHLMEIIREVNALTKKPVI